MKINEITRPDSRRAVDTILKTAGYTRLGKGMFGAVYERPGAPYVLKVFSARDQAYLEFIHIALQHQDNPHLPRFFGKPVAVTPSIWAIRMERLMPFNPTQIGGYAYALFDYIQDGQDDGEMSQMPELKAACDLVRKQLLSHYWFDHKDESFMMRGNSDGSKTVVITDVALDPVGQEQMRFSPEPSLDPTPEKQPRSQRPNSIDYDDELLRQLGAGQP